MSSDQRSNIKIFFDHLYFSVFCVFVVFFLVYGIAKWTGKGFDLDDNFRTCATIVVAATLILTAFLTFMSIWKRPKDNIVFTKRRY